jgi:pimeloyl-ACP methyl ester carboxylesterase
MVAALAFAQLPAIGAGALLYPSRRVSAAAPPQGCQQRTFTGAGVRLHGWSCDPVEPANGRSVVYLHGIADNADSARNVAARFQRSGFRFTAYDSRAHGRSEGQHCTYGFWERHDLVHVLDQTNAARVTLIGHSLGAAVALQAAAIDPRVETVVAAASFSDLRTIATERAPFFFTAPIVNRAFQQAEAAARFTVSEVSPLAAAPSIRADVLLVHGMADSETSPSHSQRIHGALNGRKQLMLVPAAGHNDVMRAEVWTEIDRWVTRQPQ